MGTPWYERTETDQRKQPVPTHMPRQPHDHQVNQRVTLRCKACSCMVFIAEWLLPLIAPSGPVQTTSRRSSCKRISGCRINDRALQRIRQLYWYRIAACACCSWWRVNRITQSAVRKDAPAPRPSMGRATQVATFDQGSAPNMKTCCMDSDVAWNTLPPMV